jgi:uncharacterized protein YfaP (DUF2135 family)
MERMWLNEAEMKYPKQWIVAVNLSWEEKNTMYGDIYLVTPDKEEAFRKEKELEESGKWGRVTSFEGFDDTPYIGGLWSNDAN